MNTTERFLIAMAIIFSLPWLVWRLARTDYYAPLVVVQIIAGVLLGPGVLGRAFPDYYQFVFTPAVVQSLNGIAWWAVMLFVMIAGIELDLKKPGSIAAKAASPPAWHSACRCCSAVRLPVSWWQARGGWGRRH